MPDIAKVSSRERLTPRREPYWIEISKGCHLGFRKLSKASQGSWIAKWRDSATGKREIFSLGDFTHLPAHLRYEQARNQATTWFEHKRKGGQRCVVTVGDACDAYIEHLLHNRGIKSAGDVKRRFEAHVKNHPSFPHIELQKLTPGHVNQWREHLALMPIHRGGKGDKPSRPTNKKRTASSLNRDITPLRAALNNSFKQGFVTTDFAWRNALKPIKNADSKRETYLDSNQRKQLISSATDELKVLLTACSLLPLRPGTLAALKVSDLNSKLKTIKIREDKAGAGRTIPLTDTAAKFFIKNAENKLPSAPLLMRDGGKAWNKDYWKWPVKTAVSKAGLPEGTTLYTLRHSTITDLAQTGVDLLTVAQLSGTSVRMIEKNYGHLTRDQALRALSRLSI